MLKLIVGLGNPGDKHEQDRHNAGFWLCDRIASMLGAKWTNDSKMKGLWAQGKMNGEDIWLLKPSTFMNLSGESVRAFAQFRKIKPNEILVAHDELDLKPGVVRLKLGGGTGGHNGLKSIQAHLGTADYWRLRLAIGHPRDSVEAGSPHQEVASYVLKRPRAEEQTLIDQAIDRTLSVLPLIMSEDPESAMKELHTQIKEPKKDSK
jgi:PTH1 family peptidyl-tRNA hydrolase